jgi:hypothetical protein
VRIRSGRLEVGTLSVTDGARISGSTQGSGQGGTATVVATDTVTITGQNSGLSTNTLGQGGDIPLQARQMPSPARALLPHWAHPYFRRWMASSCFRIVSVRCKDLSRPCPMLS